MHKEIVVGLEGVDEVAKVLHSTLLPHTILFLVGNLAAGKTTLMQAIAKSKGITESVTSPTFSLQQCYSTALFHYDLYRITHEEFMALGLYEEFEKEGWHVVEWGSDTLRGFLESACYNVATVTIVPDGTNKRKYTLDA